MVVEINFDDLMKGAAAVSKVPGAAGATQSIEGLTGSFGDRVVQALNIINQILAQWSTLSQDPTFQKLVLSRFGGGEMSNLGDPGGGPFHPRLGDNPQPPGLTQDDVIRVVRAFGVVILQDGIKRLGDKSIDELIKDYGQVKLSQILTLVRGG